MCPFNIHLPDDIPFAFAGLWECWRGVAEPLESCTIVTTSASERMLRIHDRQPVILHRNEWSVWLNPEIEDADALKTMIRPWDREVVFDSVDPCINNSRNEGVDYFKPGTNTL